MKKFTKLYINYQCRKSKNMNKFNSDKNMKNVHRINNALQNHRVAFGNKNNEVAAVFNLKKRVLRIAVCFIESF